MKISIILKSITRLILPFMIMFGVYLILHGDESPGGGFQGGVMLATAYLTTYFLNPDRGTDFNRRLKLEKIFILTLVFVSSIGIFSSGYIFTNPLRGIYSIYFMRFFLVLLNGIIGFEVALGMMIILAAFVEEGR